MYWNGMTGGHCASGVNAPATTWYLAEGCTAGGFETYLLLENPGSDDSHGGSHLYEGRPVRLPGTPVEVPAQSRKTVNLATDGAGGLVEVSTMLESDQPIIAERAVYWDNKRGGTCEFGVNAPGGYMVPGRRRDRGRFTTYVLVQNPNPTRCHDRSVLHDQRRPPGAPEWQNVAIPADTRRSFNLVEYVTDFDVSTKVVSEGGGVIAERAMYWNGMASGHDAHGLTERQVQVLPGRGLHRRRLRDLGAAAEPRAVRCHRLYHLPDRERRHREGAPSSLPAGRGTSINVGPESVRRRRLYPGVLVGAHRSGEVRVLERHDRRDVFNGILSLVRIPGLSISSHTIGGARPRAPLIAFPLAATPSHLGSPPPRDRNHWARRPDRFYKGRPCAADTRYRCVRRNTLGR